MPSISSICPSRCSSVPMPSSASGRHSRQPARTGLESARIAPQRPPGRFRFCRTFGKLGRAPDEHELPGRWGSACVNCKRCSPSSTVSKSAACASSRRATAKRRTSPITFPRNRGDAVFSVPALGDEAIAGAGSFRIAGKGTACAGALLLRRTHMKEVGAALALANRASRRFIPWRWSAACRLNFLTAPRRRGKARAALEIAEVVPME